MRRALILTSVASMIGQFNINNIKTLQKKGFFVDVIANFKVAGTVPIKNSNELKNRLEEMNVGVIDIDIKRNPCSFSNLKAYVQIKQIIEKNHYQIIHCQSPVGGVLGRLAAKKTKAKVIYTAHGFHFYKGAPKKNWFIFYPVEKFLSRYTDTLITINQEDYEISKTFAAANNILIPGVGIDVDKIRKVSVEKEKLLASLYLPLGKNVILSVGELNKNKNHISVIKALEKSRREDVIYLICGIGPLEKELKKEVDVRNLNKIVYFLGYNKNIIELIKASDIFIFPSFREGLSVALMEALACEVPIVASKIRGNTDLIQHNMNGLLFELDDEETLVVNINQILDNLNFYKEKFSINCRETIDNYDINMVNRMMSELYSI